MLKKIWNAIKRSEAPKEPNVKPSIENKGSDNLDSHQNGYLIPGFRNLFSFYKWFFLVFSAASFLYGYIYVWAYRDTIGISGLAVPFDSVYSQFVGGLLLLIKYGVGIAFLLGIVGCLLLFSTFIKKWMVNKEIYFSMTVFNLVSIAPFFILYSP